MIYFREYTLILIWLLYLQEGHRESSLFVYYAGSRYQRGMKGVHGNPGTLIVRVWLCKDQCWHTLELPYLQGKYIFSFDGLTVNLGNGGTQVSTC